MKTLAKIGIITTVIFSFLPMFDLKLLVFPVTSFICSFPIWIWELHIKNLTNN
jgi:hypothetical protein